MTIVTSGEKRGMEKVFKRLINHPMQLQSNGLDGERANAEVKRG